MKTILSILVVIFTLSANGIAQEPEPLAKDLLKIEKDIWTAWSKADGKLLTSNIMKDARIVGLDHCADCGTPYGILEWMSTKPCKGVTFDFADFRVQNLDSTVAMATFTATQSGTCGNHPLPSKAYASTVYVEQGNRWLMAYHQQTPAK